MTIKFHYDANEMAEEFRKFRSAGVTFDNSTTRAARMALSGLLAGTATQGSLTTGAIEAFNSPKSPKGKPVENFKTSSADTTTPGWGLVRKAMSRVFALHDEGKADAAIEAMLAAFVLKSPGSATSLGALEKLIRQHLADKAKAAKAAGAADIADDPEAAPIAETVPESPLSAEIESLIIRLSQASGEDIFAANDRLSVLITAISDAVSRSLSESEAIAA